MCGLYLRDTAHAEPAPVAGGFIQEFAGRLQQAAGYEPQRLDAGLWVLPSPPDTFARIADTFVAESGNVTPVLHATMAEAKAEGSRVIEARVLAWNEPLVVRSGAVVDCSGEATAAALAGAAVEEGAADQVPALVFSLENVDPSVAERGLLEVRRELRRGVEEGRLAAACERLSLVPGTGSDGRLALKLNLPPAAPGAASWKRVADWERQARALVQELCRFLVDNTVLCRNARLRSVAPQLGIRSGRRIRGRARLADQDVLGARKFAQGIARGCWAMERWGAGAPTSSRLTTSNDPWGTHGNPATVSRLEVAAPEAALSERTRRGTSHGPEMVYFEEGGYYEIPLDCLRPAELDNVWAAGRCFSAEAGAMTSARVIGTALATGWAAGTAAAFQAMGRPVDEAVEAVRRQMKQ